MRLKSYYAPSVESAIQQARRELGDEAMLLDSRPASAETRRLGNYEVIFAVSDVATNPDPPASPAASPTQTRGGEVLLDDLKSVRREMERMSAAMAHSSVLSMSAGGMLQEPELAQAYAALRTEDVPHDLAQQLLISLVRQPIRDSNGRIRPSLFDLALREQTDSRARFDAQLGRASPDAPRDARIVALVGPPGSGKTLTLVKLAMQHALAPRIPMRFVSVDNFRVGGCEQLRIYASILGVGYQAVDTIPALKSVLDEPSSKVWTWIDTPGYGPHERDLSIELAECLCARTDVDVHLVLPATMKYPDMKAAIERFRLFEPDKLIFTRLDETEHYGGLWSAMATSGIPISYLAGGQRIPEDVEAATPVRLRTLFAPELRLSPVTLAPSAPVKSGTPQMRHAKASAGQ